MPVLAAIFRDGEPRCALHGTDHGTIERETEWGTLYRCGDHYTLISRPQAQKPKRSEGHIPKAVFPGERGG